MLTQYHLFISQIAKALGLGQGPEPSKSVEKPDPIVSSNCVDEASWESFPASDPPAWNATTVATENDL